MPLIEYVVGLGLEACFAVVMLVGIGIPLKCIIVFSLFLIVINIIIYLTGTCH